MIGRATVFLLLLAMGAAARTLTGRLVDEAGQPLAGVTVWPCAQSSNWADAVAPATTAADGTFTMALPEAPALGADLPLVARVPGRGCVVERVSLSPTALAAPVRLQLRAAGSLDGIILDQARRPVPGAVVAPLYFEVGGAYLRLTRACARALWPCQADDQGRWRLDDLPVAGRRELLAGAPGLAETNLAAGAGFQPSPACYAILPPGGSLAGRVVGEDGRGVGGLRLTVGWHEATTDANGEYLVASLPPGPERVRVASPGSAGWAVVPIAPPVVVAGQVTRSADLRAVAPAVLRGRYLAPPLQLNPPTRTDGTPYRMDMDSTGRFEVMVPPGQYRFTGLVQPVDVSAGQTRDLGDLTAGQQQAGTTVLDDAGQALANTDVWLSTEGTPLRPARTDGQGRLTWTSSLVANNNYLVVVVPGRWLVSDPQAAGAPATLRLAPARTTALSGQVLDAAGQPVAGATVGLTLSGVPHAGRAPSALRLTTDARGAWRYDAVPVDWRGELVAGAPGCRPSRELTVDRLGERIAHGLVIERVPARASGRVVDEAGRPVAGAMVLAQDYVDGPPALTAADGGFTLERLPTHAVTVVAMAGPRRMARARVTPPAAGLTLRLAEPPAPAWTAADQVPSDEEVDLAHDLVRAALQPVTPEACGLAILGRIDPAEMLERLAALPAAERLGLLPGVLAYLPPQVRLDENALLLLRDMPGVFRSALSCLVATHLPRERREVLAKVLAEARAARNPAATGPEAVLTDISLAGLSLLAGSPTADADLAQMVATCQKDKPTFEAVLELLAMIELHPKQIDKLLELATGAHAKGMLQENRLRGLMATDPVAALALARQWWPGPRQTILRPAALVQRERRASRFVDDLVAALAVDHLDDATALLAGIERDEEAASGLLAAAWSTRDAARARRLAEQADGRLPAHGGPGGSLLALVEPLAPAVAARRRETLLGEAPFAVNLVRDDLGQTSAIEHRGAEAAYALALTDPNRARWAVETLWNGGATDGQHAEQLVAMAMIDAPRAVEMARHNACSYTDRLALACWLLADRRDRCTLPTAAWAESNVVWPGHDRLRL